MTENETVTSKIIDPLLTAVQSGDLDVPVEDQVTKVLEKLGEELSNVNFIPSNELIILVDELMVTLNEDDDPFIENEEDDDDLDEDEEDLI